MTNDEYKMMKYIIKNQPIRFADFQNKFLHHDKKLYIFYSLVDSSFVKIQSQFKDILDDDPISATYDGIIAFQRHASFKTDSFKNWLFREYAGGILVGATGALLAEALLLLCIKLLALM